jgi:hypothetical protein
LAKLHPYLRSISRLGVLQATLSFFLLISGLLDTTFAPDIRKLPLPVASLSFRFVSDPTRERWKRLHTKVPLRAAERGFELSQYHHFL